VLQAARDLSERTIHFHFSDVNSKLGAANRAEAVAVELQRKLLPP